MLYTDLWLGSSMGWIELGKINKDELFVLVIVSM